MDWNLEGGGGPSSLWIGAEAWMDGWMDGEDEVGRWT